MEVLSCHKQLLLLSSSSTEFKTETIRQLQPTLMVLLVKCFQQEMLCRDSREALQHWDRAVAVHAALGPDWEGSDKGEAKPCKNGPVWGV